MSKTTDSVHLKGLNRTLSWCIPPLIVEEKHAYVHTYLNSSQSQKLFIPVYPELPEAKKTPSEYIEIYKKDFRIVFIDQSDTPLLRNLLQEVL